MKGHQLRSTARRTLMRIAGIVAVLTLAMLAPRGSSMAEDGERLDQGKAIQGKSLFKAWCRSCHGESAKGDGPMADYLRPRPADLTLLSQKEGGHFYFGRVRAKIDGRDKVHAHGSKDMPVWGEAFRVVDEAGGEEAVQEKITALVHFLASIQAEEEPDSN